MKTEDTEVVERQRAKPTKIKAGYNRPTCKNSSYHCTPFYCTQYCNTETVLLISPSSKHLRCGQVEVRGKILSEFRIIKSASKKGGSFMWYRFVYLFVCLFVCLSPDTCWPSSAGSHASREQLAQQTAGSHTSREQLAQQTAGSHASREQLEHCWASQRVPNMLTAIHCPCKWTTGPAEQHTDIPLPQSDALDFHSTAHTR